jgi:hypothetical protein
MHSDSDDSSDSGSYSYKPTIAVRAAPVACSLPKQRSRVGEGGAAQHPQFLTLHAHAWDARPGRPCSSAHHREQRRQRHGGRRRAPGHLAHRVQLSGLPLRCIGAQALTHTQTPCNAMQHAMQIACETP